MELEKKKIKPIKKCVMGPAIRYHSVKLPVGTGIEKEGEEGQEESQLVEEIMKLEDGHENESAPPLPPLQLKKVDGESQGELFERTFISFSSEIVLKKTFEKFKGNTTKPVERRCALTK